MFPNGRSILESCPSLLGEAIFDVEDPIPFLMVNHWQIPVLLLKPFERQTLAENRL